MSWVHGDRDLGMPLPGVPGVDRNGLSQILGGRDMSNRGI